MDVTFHRLPAGRYYSTAVRDDGVTVRVPGYDRVQRFPHDLAHFIGERELGMTRGFWGSVAAGAMFTNMAVLSGRRRPHAAERSKLILKEHADGIGDAEAVAAALHDTVAGGHGAEHLLKVLRRTWSSQRAAPFPLTPADAERAVAALAAAVQDWAALQEHESLTLTWHLPVERHPLIRPHKRQPHRAR